MVLEDLSSNIIKALNKLNQSTVINEEILDSILKDIARALLLADVNARLVSQLRKNVKHTCNVEDLQVAGTNKTKRIRKAVFDELVRMLQPDKKAFVPKKGQCNVFMFVGLQGSGKTTTVSKFAHYWAKKGWKTCMVCCDTFRAGALDQIKQNAIKLHIPYYGNPYEADPVKLAEEGVEQFRNEGYEIILVDTSGRHKQEVELFEEMEQVMEVAEPDEVIFVMDSTAGQGVFDQAAAFKESVPVGSVVVTKLDGNAKGGGALSAVAATNSPITFIGTGEHFDEFEHFDARSFVSRLLGMGDLKGLIETFKEKTDLFEKAPEMMERLQKGVFTLRDMKEQFASVMKMGNMSQLMSMIPGMSNIMPKGHERDGAKRIQMFMTCMDSMTDDELDGIFKSRKWDEKDQKHKIVVEKYFNASRIRRIALGSGTSVQIVQLLLQCHRQFEKMIDKMGKNGLMKQTDAGMAQRMQRNPQAVMQQLQRSMDPRMMQQLGGAQNMMKMMKEMGNNMPDMFQPKR
mmetsp:Transcript_2151/g.2466  ORF Transcript_2151/g.2466 Transcript_2151/m.2466 type:complete len:515 (+) Transcript_2151:132-1676(+)